MLLLASDLDRTIIPNGKEPASEDALPLLRTVAKHPELTLAYVSGRGEALLKEGIEEFNLPVPHFAIGDVGTSIFLPSENWQQLEAYQEEIAMDWNGKTSTDLRALFADIDVLTLQEEEKQNTFKLSYYAPEDTNRDSLLKKMNKIIEQEKLQASLIWSIDEAAGTGLLDVLPASATKLHAVQFLMKYLNIDEAHTVFAGDSGNDLPALTSGLQAVLVKNARSDVRQEAEESLKKQGLIDKLYVAKGDFFGMNGNYSAGVLEGLVHFRPEVQKWLNS